MPPVKEAISRISCSSLRSQRPEPLAVNGTSPAAVSYAKVSKVSSEFTEDKAKFSSQKATNLSKKRRVRLRIPLLAYCFIIVVALFTFSVRRARRVGPDARHMDTDLPRNKAFKLMTRRGLRFEGASNPNLHFVGRWSATYPGQRRDAGFPGAYLEFILHNSSSLFLYLYNFYQRGSSHDHQLNASANIDVRHLDLRLTDGRYQPAAPVSLVVLVNKHEPVVHSHTGAGVIEIADRSLNSSLSYHLRVIYPGHHNGIDGTLQLEGLWLDQRGGLSHVHKSCHARTTDKDFRSRKVNSIAGNSSFTSLPKIVEIVTDSSVGLAQQNVTPRNNTSHKVMQDIASWESLLSEAFLADHITVNVDGLCLASNCNNATISISDAYFRSGPASTLLFSRPWNFSSYTPDVLVLNIGTSDSVLSPSPSSSAHSSAFVSAYVSLIQSIRGVAYPSPKPSFSHSSPSPSVNYSPSYVQNSAPATLPIFILRPFSGAFEAETLTVARKLWAEGDTRVFWVDTTGWVEWSRSSNPSGLNRRGEEAKEDVDTDVLWSKPYNRYILTPRGHQKVAAYLNPHVCRHLATNPKDECEFLGHESGYPAGKAVRTLSNERESEREREKQVEKVLEEGKWRRIREMFFREDGY